MQNNKNDLLNYFQSLTNRELFDIFNGKEDDYLPEAIEIAKEEVKIRGGLEKLKAEILEEDKNTEREYLNRKDILKKDGDKETIKSEMYKLDYHKEKIPTFKLTFGIVFLFLGIIILVLRYELISLFFSKDAIIKDLLKGGEGINTLSIVIIISSIVMILIGIILTVLSIIKLSKR